jgi:hypothetical protein
MSWRQGIWLEEAGSRGMEVKTPERESQAVSSIPQSDALASPWEGSIPSGQLREPTRIRPESI